MKFGCLLYKSFENTVEKGDIAHNEQFLLFPQCFLPIWRTFLPFSSNLKLSSANCVSLVKSTICCFGKLTLNSIDTNFTNQQQTAFENTGKRTNCS